MYGLGNPLIVSVFKFLNIPHFKYKSKTNPSLSNACKSDQIDISLPVNHWSEIVVINTPLGLSILATSFVISVEYNEKEKTMPDSLNITIYNE